MPVFQTLDQWLGWQSSLNPRTIVLGLERVEAVWERLGTPALPVVISVAGTNGKGSCVAFLESILRQAGYGVGCYTSPHLLAYNERIRVDGESVDDEQICRAFEQIDAVRDDIPLTYFEFGTLAALLIFSESALNAVVLEVGLGGRLDAVNLIDADAALITGIALDHQDWLGDDLEAIAYEKAGIMRSDRPAVYAATHMPQRIAEHAAAIGADLLRAGGDFSYQVGANDWQWRGRSRLRNALPAPAMRGLIQYQNAAGVLQVLECLADRLPVDQTAIRSGLLSARVAGRFEVRSGKLMWIFDVAHNPQAAEALARQLGDFFVKGKTHALLGMLSDKDVRGVLQILDSRVDHWHLAGLREEARGLSGAELADRLRQAGIDTPHKVYSDMPRALDSVAVSAKEGDLVLVFGSFYTVAAAIRWWDKNPSGYNSLS